MIRSVERTTAMLAAAFGVSLLVAGTIAQNADALDRKTARELAVLSRVLEKRLVELRRSVSEDGRTV